MQSPKRHHANHSVLYLASGTRGTFRETLTQFGHRTLVDHSFRTSACELQPRASKVEKIRGNAEDALIDLYLLGRKYDCLVIVNEGLREGGGQYPLHRGATMGLASLVIGSYYIHIAAPSYYGDEVCNLGTHLLDLPFVRDEIGFGDRDRVETRGISNLDSENIRQWRMARVSSITRGNRFHYPYTLHWRSVWHDADQYDAVFLPEDFQGNFWHRLNDLTKKPVLRMPERYGFPSRDWEDHTRVVGEKPQVTCPIQYCRQHGVKRIAVVPSSSESAIDLLARFREQGNDIDLHFYHLRVDSLAALYPVDSQIQVCVPGTSLPFR